MNNNIQTENREVSNLELGTTLYVFCRFYTITAPGTIRTESNYTIVVSLHQSAGPATINVGLKGPQLLKSKKIELQPYSTKKITFNVSDYLRSDSVYKKHFNFSFLTFLMDLTTSSLKDPTDSSSTIPQNYSSIPSAFK